MLLTWVCASSDYQDYNQSQTGHNIASDGLVESHGSNCEVHFLVNFCQCQEFPNQFLRQKKFRSCLIKVSNLLKITLCPGNRKIFFSFLVWFQHPLLQTKSFFFYFKHRDHNTHDLYDFKPKFFMLAIAGLLWGWIFSQSDSIQ